MSRIRTVTILLCLIVALSTSVSAQDTNPFFISKTLYENPNKPERTLSIDYADVIYWSGSITVIQSSRHKYELNPLFQGQNGEFTTGRAIAATSLTWGIFKILEYKHPKHKRLIFWVKISVGVMHFGFVPHNSRIRKAF